MARLAADRPPGANLLGGLRIERLSSASDETAEASQTMDGHLLISWLLDADECPRRRAREVVVVLQQGAIARMTAADAALRRGIAQAARDSVARALDGYDPEGPAVPSFHIYLDEPELGY